MTGMEAHDMAAYTRPLLAVCGVKRMMRSQMVVADSPAHRLKMAEARMDSQTDRLETLHSW